MQVIATNGLNCNLTGRQDVPRRWFPTPFGVGAWLAVLALAGVLMVGHPALAEPEHAGTPAAPAASEPGTESGASHGTGSATESIQKPTLASALPFVVLLLCIAILPLVPQAHFWHKNEAKLAIALALGLITLVYYAARGHGLSVEGHVSEPGLPTAKAVLTHSVLGEYIPFIVLLFSLYTISGGIRLTGDLRATPLTNSGILGIGAVLASFVGTTGASMLLIRPLLQTNRERKHVCHTVIFFIFLVSNVGGCLLPIGDPPLFLGYLYGVPFLWTFRLVLPWAVCIGILLALYFAWDTVKFRSEGREDIAKDASQVEPMRIEGALNFLWLLGVILAVAFLVPGSTLLGFEIKPWVREAAQLLLVVAAWKTTAPKVRRENGFNFLAIGEVAALFIGIFITMQAPIECLQANADTIRQSVNSPWQFFWMTGALSSFLDNAPTYAVFFRMAESMTTPGLGATVALKGGTQILQQWLVAVSLGAVFMGANTYIGNGPNFMVKSIAEQSGVQMPSFFGYMFRYSVPILLPIFGIITLIFFVG